MIALNDLLLLVAVVLGAGGVILVALPRALPKVEEKLNARWGEQEILALRLGLPGEKSSERILNRDVLSQSVYWDDWVRKHPRLTGILFCLLAIGLWAWSRVA